MAKGGYRPGAGRPRKFRPAVEPVPVKSMAVVVQPQPVPSPAVLRPVGMLPLEYMLAVMADPETPPDRRDRAAIAAAPYCHPRIDRVTQSKKDEAAKDAKDAGTGKFATPLPPKLIVNNR